MGGTVARRSRGASGTSSWTPQGCCRRCWSRSLLRRLRATAGARVSLVWVDGAYTGARSTGHAGLGPGVEIAQRPDLPYSAARVRHAMWATEHIQVNERHHRSMDVSKAGNRRRGFVFSSPRLEVGSARTAEPVWLPCIAAQSVLVLYTSPWSNWSTGMSRAKRYRTAQELAPCAAKGLPRFCTFTRLVYRIERREQGMTGQEIIKVLVALTPRQSCKNITRTCRISPISPSR